MPPLRPPIRMTPVRVAMPEAQPKPPPLTVKEVALVGAEKGEIKDFGKIGVHGERVLAERKDKPLDELLKDAERPTIRAFTAEEKADNHSRFELIQQDRLKQAEDRVQNITTYARLRKTNDGNEFTPESIVAAKAIDPRLEGLTPEDTVKKLTEIRTQALTDICQLDVFKNLFPEELAQLTPERRIEIAEELFAEQADFQGAVAARLETWQQKVKGLKPASEGAPQSDVTDRATKRITDRLGKDSTDVVKKDEIAQQLRDGRTVDEVADDMTIKLAHRREIANPTGIAAVVRLDRQSATLQTEIVSNQSVIDKLEVEANLSTGSQRKAALEAERTKLIIRNAQATAEKTTLDARLTQKKTEYGNKVDEDSTKYRSIEDQVYGIEEQDGTRQGGIKSDLKLVKDSIEKSGKEQKPQAEGAAEQGQEREALLSDFESILNNSLSDSMHERATLTTESCQRLVTADADELKQKGELGLEAATRRMGKGGRDEYRHVDARGKVTYLKETQSEDFDIMSSDPEGFERIVVRVLSKGENPLIDFDKLYPDGSDRDLIISRLRKQGFLKGTKPTWEQAKTQAWRVVDLETFSQTPDGELVKKMVADQGETYRTQFMAGYLDAQSIAEQHGVGILAKNKNQWKRMYEQHPDSIVNGWNKNETLNDFKADLESQRVNIANLGSLTALMALFGSFKSDDES